MGNSEVGHLNIGAGRVVMQDLPRIGDAIASGEIAQQPALQDLIARLKASGGTCHLMGLVSPGGVHSHQDHAVGLAKILAARRRADRGACLDRRPRHAAAIGRRRRRALSRRRCRRRSRSRPCAGATMRWTATSAGSASRKAYAAMVDAEGPRFPDAGARHRGGLCATRSSTSSSSRAIVGDYRGMRDGDGILCFNFRADRVREILAAMLDPAFSGFARPRVVKFAGAVGMTQYSDELDKLMQAIFPPQSLTKILGEVVADAGRTQLRTAETEKYPHVTYFLNGGREQPFPGEDRIMVPSPKVATYDLQPEMSAPELTDKVVAAIDSGKYDLIVLNYANPDMVGHTGSLPAAIKAVETVDAGLGRIADAIERAGGALLVTADHGNCEMMRDPETGGPHTAHTTNPVPLFLLGARNRALVTEGRLADLAPTLLELMELPQPKEMTGVSLLRAS